MTIDVQKIEELAKAATQGKWNWESDPVKNDPTGRVRYQVTTIGKTITKIYYSSYEGGLTNAEYDAKYIAAANPSTILWLIDHIKNLEEELKHADFDKVIAEKNKLLEEIIMKIPGGSICDPQQIADMIRTFKDES